MSKTIKIGNVEFGGEKLPLIAGPCVIESRDHSLHMAESISSIADSINIPFIFTNQFKGLNNLQSSSIKLDSVAPGADIFVGRIAAPIPEFNVQLGVVANYDAKSRLADIHNEFESYHYLSTNSEMTDIVDITAPESNLHSLYPRYKNIIITQDSLFIPQTFFDALLYGNKVYFKAKYESQQKKASDTLNSSFGGEGLFDYKNKHSSKKIKKTLLKKHTCLSRTKRIISNLKHKDLEKKLSDKIKEYADDHSGS